MKRRKKTGKTLIKPLGFRINTSTTALTFLQVFFTANTPGNCWVTQRDPVPVRKCCLN